MIDAVPTDAELVKVAKLSGLPVYMTWYVDGGVDWCARVDGLHDARRAPAVTRSRMDARHDAREMTNVRKAYYNENDPFAAAWLRRLIDTGRIPAGDVDERSIADVKGKDVEGYGQVHFFAGIGGWPLALRLLGVPDEAEIWTGSCPCQPFSNAGKRKGEADARHLWPEFRRLIRVGRPPVVFGEQIAGPDGVSWLDRVRADLEAARYAVGASDLPAAGVGAPHIRQRLWFGAVPRRVEHAPRERRFQWWPEPGGRGAVGGRPEGEGGLADAGRAGDERGGGPGSARGAAGETAGEARGQRRGADAGRGRGGASAGGRGAVGGRPEGEGGVADAAIGGREYVAGLERVRGQKGGRERLLQPGDNGARGVSAGGLGHADVEGPQGRGLDAGERRDQRAPGPASLFGPWGLASDVDCNDGKTRRVGPGVLVVAHGVSDRVGKLRGIGNAIVPWVAAEFIAGFLDAVSDVDVTPEK